MVDRLEYLCVEVDGLVALESDADFLEHVCQALNADADWSMAHV